MTPIEAIAMLNNMFESHDGRPVDNAVLHVRDYAAIVGTLIEWSRKVERLEAELADINDTRDW